VNPTGASFSPQVSTGSPPSLDDPVWLSKLQRLLLVCEDLEDFLQRVAMLSAEAMPMGNSFVIAVELPGRPPIVVGSDEGSLAVGKIECTHGEGPCMEVRHSGQPVYLPDLNREGRRWAFGIEALAHGMRSLLAIPIPGPAGVVGVVSLFATRAHAYDRAARRRVQVFAESVADIIAVALRLADQIQLNKDLRSALESRSAIDQAIGVIMAENRCDRETAFEILRRASQNRNTKLRDVAADLVYSITGHQPAPGPFCPRQ
jgi:transcriptional regulator with GAF, ATPase, and Fis domain